MKIIFLDIDGVLNSTFTDIYTREVKKENGHSAVFDGTAVMALNNIILGYEEEIRFVISSTWRSRYTKEEMENQLYSFGFKGLFHEDWSTKLLYKKRGLEVQEWLSRHSEVDTWICLDDSMDFIEESNLVLTNGDTGISIYEVLLSKFLLGLIVQSNKEHERVNTQEFHQKIINDAELIDVRKYYSNFKEHYNQRYFV